jgi:polar amino acid transport system substrate-binding protein
MSELASDSSAQRGLAGDSSAQRGPLGVLRPVLYLAVAAVLALGTLLLPDGSAAEVAAPAPPPAAAAPAAPACTEVVGSLRPQGPLPAPGAMPAGSTMAAIAARGRLIAGVDQGKFNLGYRDPLTGQLRGADIDLVRQIAAAILGDPEKVQYVVLDIADRAQALVDKRVDVVVNTFTITCPRQQLVEFSTPYLAASQRILVTRGSGVAEVEQLAGRRVCTSRGSTTEVVLRDLPLRLVVVTYAGIPDCMLDLQRGRVDAVSSDEVILAGLAAQDPQTEVVGRSLIDAFYGVGINKGQPDLVRFVNALLERGRADGSLAAIDRRWFSILDRIPRPAAARYRD